MAYRTTNSALLLLLALASVTARANVPISVVLESEGLSKDTKAGEQLEAVDTNGDLELSESETDEARDQDEMFELDFEMHRLLAAAERLLNEHAPRVADSVVASGEHLEVRDVDVAIGKLLQVRSYEVGARLAARASLGIGAFGAHFENAALDVAGGSATIQLFPHWKLVDSRVGIALGPLAQGDLLLGLSTSTSGLWASVGLELGGRVEVAIALDVAIIRVGVEYGRAVAGWTTDHLAYNDPSAVVRRVTIAIGEGGYRRKVDRDLMRKAAEHSLKVRTIPKGALVEVNGTVVGTTPMIVRWPRDEQVILRLLRDGFHDVRYALDASTDGKTLSERLVPRNDE